MELTKDAEKIVIANLMELELLTGKEFAAVNETEMQKMRGVMQSSYYRCKRCGMYVPGYSDAVGTHRPRYCSNCGAKAVK